MDWDALIAGGASGITQIFTGYPLDTMKTWAQNNNISHKPKVNFMNLYKGIQFPLLQSPFTIATGFFVNENVYQKCNNIYISSFCSGLCITALLCPFDYYKINYQQQKIPVLKNSYNKIHIVALREVPANMCYFSTYHYLRKNGLSPGVSGAISGVCSWGLTYPMDTIKSRLQIHNNLSLKEAILEGSLYKGLLIACIRAGIVNFVGFEVYEYSRKLLKNKTITCKGINL